MKRRVLGFLLVALLWALPVAAQPPEETLHITATAATSTQSGGSVTRPLWATGMIVVVGVTAGSTLLLDVSVQGYSPSLDAWFDWTINCPSVSAITGVGTTVCYFGHGGEPASYEIPEKIVTLPEVMRLWVDHTNANPATYTIRTQWVSR